MDEMLLQMIRNRDEAALERIYFEDECPVFFSVDWGAEDDSIVRACARCLGLDSLSAEWKDEKLVIVFEDREHVVPLNNDVGDRHITACALNDVLENRFQVRFIVVSHGSDTMGFAALSVEGWRTIEATCPVEVAENFIDPRVLPNIVTELIDDTLPPAAKARFKRLLNR